VAVAGGILVGEANVNGSAHTEPGSPPGHYEAFALEQKFRLLKQSKFNDKGERE